MLLEGGFLIVLVVLQTFSCAPLQDEKNEPVILNYFCTRIITEGEGPEKSAIILIHGMGASLDNWKGVLEVLALRTGRKVCAVDLRNHGDSPWNDRYGVSAMTADIGYFLDTKKIEKVNLIGHSLGGKVAMHYTLNNPDRVNSLVVEDMRPNSITEQALQLVVAAMKLLQEGINKVPEGSNVAEARKIIKDFVKEKLKELGSEEEISEFTDETIPIRCTNGKCQFKMNIDVLNKGLQNPEEMLVESTGLYEGPTLFIYGKKSEFDIPGDKENILKLFPKAQLVGVEGVGHEVHGKSRQFDDEVIRFLKPLN